MIENKSLGSKIFDVLNVVFLVIVMLICIMPVWYVLCVSLSSREAGLSTLFQTNFFRLFFRYCTGV